MANPATGATVRVREGRTVVDDDGPTGHEYLAGYYLVDCETRDRAIELAAMLPDARLSAIGVRAVMGTAGHELM